MSNARTFNKELEYSEKMGDEPFWEKTYNTFFPGIIVGHMQTSGDYQSQRMGIDRLIMLSNGRTLRIDEKKRRTNWGDIALETHHTTQKNIHSAKTGAGWITKNLFIDYLAYAIMPTHTVYLFDWLLLQLTWENNKKEWYEKAMQSGQNGYTIASSKNVSYWSHNLCVPIGELQTAITKSNVALIKKDTQ